MVTFTFYLLLFRLLCLKLIFSGSSGFIIDTTYGLSNEVNSKSKLPGFNNTTYNCPEWSFYYDGVCKCPHTYQLDCYKDSLLVHDCSCISYDEDLGLYEYGYCEYTCGFSDASKHSLTMPRNISMWNQFLCGRFKRSGTLCSKCDQTQDLYPRAYSFDRTCIECATNSSYAWFLYILAAFIPLTIFCLITLLCRINIHSSPMQGYVLFGQLISISVQSRLSLRISKSYRELSPAIKLIGTLYSIWNLDFFRMYYPGFCLKLGELAILALDFMVAFYPLLLVGASYAMVKIYDKKFKLFILIWKPIGNFFQIFRKKWDLRSSIIDSFSTFFFLSNMKFLSVCYDMLAPVRVYHYKNATFVNYTWRLYYDPSVPYFQGPHVAYALLAISVLTVFVILPVLMLMLHPFRWYQKLLNNFPSRLQIALLTFVDSFQGCYKNGTESNSKDCRWYSTIILTSRFVLLLIYALSLNYRFYFYSVILFTFLAMLTIWIDPFKSHFSHYSFTSAIHLLCAAAFHLCLLSDIIFRHNHFNSTSVAILAFTALLPTLSIILMVIQKIIRKMMGLKSFSHCDFKAHNNKTSEF